MTILGAILAGGAARRFGQDKAAALIGGRAMIARVAERLSAQCDALVVVGRDWPGIMSIPDRPRPGLGPLGGLAGALVQAQADGHAYVLTSGCDLPDLPGDLATRLSPAPAVVQGQPLLGLWRADGANALIAWLEQDGDRAMRSWIAASGARRVPLDRMPVNINTPADMTAFALRADGIGPD